MQLLRENVVGVIANGARINENEKNENEGASAVSYIMRCYPKEHLNTKRARNAIRKDA